MDAIKLVADNNGYIYGVQYGTEFLENVTINNKSYNYSENELDGCMLYIIHQEI
ncbi:MAG: hypothetical protein ACLRPW_08800 [Intestinibacter sp.]